MVQISLDICSAHMAAGLYEPECISDNIRYGFLWYVLNLILPGKPVIYGRLKWQSRK
jgi:hypothetical protein